MYFLEKEGKWRAEISWKDNTGRLHRKSFQDKKQSEVKSKLAEFKKQLLLSNRNLNPHTESFRFFSDFWVENILKPKVKPLSYQRKVSTLEHQVYPYLGELDIGQISHTTVQEMINALSLSGLSYSTIKKALEVVNGCLRYYRVKTATSYNPCEGADFYRAWAESSWLAPIPKKESIRHLHGWQRIILKHQHGAIYNRFEDLVRIYKEGAKYGINMILLFAWWEEGMDNGYPNYQPSDELGGVDALKKAIKEIEELGGRVILYSNGHIIDKATEYYKTEGYRYTMKDIEGNDYEEKYQFSNSGTLLKIGHKTFATGCFGTKEWAGKVEELELRQLSLDAKGTFFDQLGCAFKLCFDTTHSHGNRIDEDPSLRLQTVKKLRTNLGDDEWFGTEWVGDRISPEMDFTHGYGNSIEFAPDAYPYMFRYTFPECTVSNRLIHDEKEGWEKHLNYACVHGMIFDVALWRCRIRSIDDLPNYGKKVGELIALRKQYLDYFTLGSFDMFDLPNGVWGAKYTYNGKSIAALWNDTDQPYVMAGQTVEPKSVSVLCID